MHTSTKIGAVVVAGALGFALYYQMNMMHSHQTELAYLREKTEALASSKGGDASQALCMVNGETKSWGSLQNGMKDAVVQVFTDVADFNWLEPYKSPQQYQSSGSGFFITDTGHFITNAHVVDQAKGIGIQIPSFGKRRFDVILLGVSPDRDLALLKLKDEDREDIVKALGKIPTVTIGDSDAVHRSDEIMAIGYPLGQQGLKSTTGIVSGREHLAGQHYIQISAPINPGSSGGPSINCAGQVIGVNSAGVPGAQNVGYVIPASEVKLFLKHLEQMPDTGSTKFLRKPFMGILFNPASDAMTKFLGNPLPGGLYVAGTQKGSPLAKAGIEPGDMIYEMDGYRLDTFGEMNVPWNEDKISVIDYISRLTLGDQVKLLVYRNGKPRTIKLTFKESELMPVRRIYPAYEKVDYEMFGGLVVMPLALNHLPMIVQAAPELTQYMELQNQLDGALLVTHVFPTSQAARTRTLGVGAIITEINGEKVHTLGDLRRALAKSLDSKFVTLKTRQQIFAVMPFEAMMKDEPRLAADYFYQITPFMKDLLAHSSLPKQPIKNLDKPAVKADETKKEA